MFANISEKNAKKGKKIKLIQLNVLDLSVESHESSVGTDFEDIHWLLEELEGSRWADTAWVVCSWLAWVLSVSSTLDHEVQTSSDHEDPSDIAVLTLEQPIYQPFSHQVLLQEVPLLFYVRPMESCCRSPT